MAKVTRRWMRCETWTAQYLCEEEGEIRIPKNEPRLSVSQIKFECVLCMDKRIFNVVSFLKRRPRQRAQQHGERPVGDTVVVLLN
jgi:hypothetical protein